MSESGRNLGAAALRPSGIKRHRLAWVLIGTLVCVVLLGLGVHGRTEEATGVPEADRVLRVQTDLPFQVLVPGYLPPEFNRGQANATIGSAALGNRRDFQIVYPGRQPGAAIFVGEWQPISSTLETLVGSRPIETKWGRGYLLADEQGGFSTVWADVDGLRVAVTSSRSSAAAPDDLLAIVNSLGPAANQRASVALAQKPVIRAAPTPVPVEATSNDQGVQELTLVATSTGYVPSRFAVRAGVPMKLTFRQLGDATCAGELVFPADPAKPARLNLASAQDQKILEFTPAALGDFVFRCAHDIFRGVMTVR